VTLLGVDGRIAVVSDIGAGQFDGMESTAG
jgi:hypothetical protein